MMEVKILLAVNAVMIVANGVLSWKLGQALRHIRRRARWGSNG